MPFVPTTNTAGIKQLLCLSDSITARSKAAHENALGASASFWKVYSPVPPRWNHSPKFDGEILNGFDGTGEITVSELH